MVKRVHTVCPQGGTARARGCRGFAGIIAQAQWILTLTLLKPRFRRTFVQDSLNVFTFFLISDAEIKLTDRYKRIASPQPVPLATRVKECVQTQCVFNIFNAPRSESLHRHDENEFTHRLHAVYRFCAAPAPALSRLAPVPPWGDTVRTLLTS